MEKTYKIVPYTLPNKEQRYVIIDLEGTVIDDASGYYYTSIEKANKAAWWKFGGGKEKYENKK